MRTPLFAQIKLVVCDLDNTLYDWVTFFSKAFYAMVETVVPILDVPKDQILDEFQDVHKRYGDSEPPFALLEIPSVKNRYPDKSPKQLQDLLDPAFHSFNSARKKYLLAYPGVENGLTEIKMAGTKIVAHTEATVVNAEYRLRKLNLIDYFSCIYAVQDKGPGHPNPQQLKQSLRTHKLQILSLHHRKPDTQILLKICADAGVTPSSALYIGDSIPRDIGMAHAAGVHSAWAKYGTSFDKEDWDRLVRITHWTDEDVRRADHARKMYGATVPEVVLEERFDEILNFYDFIAP